MALRLPSEGQIQTRTEEGSDGQIGRPTRVPVMSLCAQCGEPTPDSRDLCIYHSSGQGDGWAVGNRIMCDFLHRGIVSTGPAESVARSIDLLDDRLEAALTE